MISSSSASFVTRDTLVPAPDITLWCDYIYLDTDERRRFAQVSHEYLIEQVQRESGIINAEKLTVSTSLNFNHPVKELIWVVQETSAAEESTSYDRINPLVNTSVQKSKNWHHQDYFNFQGSSDVDDKEYISGMSTSEGFGDMKLQLNGHERFTSRKATYFRTCQPQQHGHKVPSKHIYCYSFALKPEDHQPSGTCNFSRIDNAEMVFSKKAGQSTRNLNVYAVNYNVLRIMSGMGGLAYSN